jgi:hypothetical protein
MTTHPFPRLLPVLSFLSALVPCLALGEPQASLVPNAEGSAVQVVVAGDPGAYEVRASADLATWGAPVAAGIAADGTASVTFPFDGAPLFFDAERVEAWDCVAIETSGASFAPEIECSGAVVPDILWQFDGGVRSTAYPAAFVTYATAAPRRHVLTVRPPAHLTEINLGYDGGDGGTAPVNYLAAQGVTAVRFPAEIGTLAVFCASNNQGLTELDLSRQKALEIVECYCTSNLSSVKVANLPNVRRLCFEDCDLEALDISGCPNLEDLRGAVNRYTQIVVGGGTGPKMWHWCTRDNPQLQQNFCDFMGDFSAMQELFIWNDNQHGAFRIGSHVLTSLQAADNHFTSAELGDQPNVYSVDFSRNELASFSIGECPTLQELRLSSNNLGTAAVDAILAWIELHATSLSLVDLSYNAGGPSDEGMAVVARLRARGVNVSVDEPDVNDGIFDVEGGDSAVTFTSQATSVSMEIRTSAAPESIVWHWGDGTVTTGATAVTHRFTSTVRHVNYVEVVPTSAVTYFGAQGEGQGVTGVRSLNHFPNVNFLYLYNEQVRELSLAGCGKLVQLHLAANPFDSDVCDQLFIDLDAAVTEWPVTGSAFYFPSGIRTSASDAAYAGLIAKGYAMYPY